MLARRLPALLQPDASPVRLLVPLARRRTIHAAFDAQLQASWHPACHLGKHPIVTELVGRRHFGAFGLAHLGEVLACQHQDDFGGSAEMLPDVVEDLSGDVAE